MILTLIDGGRGSGKTTYGTRLAANDLNALFIDEHPPFTREGDRLLRQGRYLSPPDLDRLARGTPMDDVHLIVVLSEHLNLWALDFLKSRCRTVGTVTMQVGRGKAPDFIGMRV